VGTPARRCPACYLSVDQYKHKQRGDGKASKVENDLFRKLLLR
jgi:hypothetical protein